MRLLVKGENATLTSRRFRVRVSAAAPVDVCALLLGTDGKVLTESDFVFYNQPSTAGIVLLADSVDLDLDAFPASADRAICAVSVDDDQPPMGNGTVRAFVVDPGGIPLFEFTPVGLAGERAVILFEIYRRQMSWKVRAVGQGYDGGLAALVTAHGVEVEDAPAASPAERRFHTPGEYPAGQEYPARSERPARGGYQDPGEYQAQQTVSAAAAATPPAPPGTTDPERQLRVLTGIFEDAARSASAYRSAVSFAEQRRMREMGNVFDDPRTRESGHPARPPADERYADLVTRATADHRRDVEVLAAELRELAPSLPAALAPWESTVWQSGRFGTSAGVRAGELHLPEAPDLRIPLVLGVPLRRPLWLYGAAAGDAAADADGLIAMARALIIRLLAADSSIRLHLCDPDGAVIAALGNLVGPAVGLLGAPIARTREQVSETLRVLVEHVDLLEMARTAGALDALPMDDTKVLLVITDVPSAFDEKDHQLLRYLVEHAATAQLLIRLMGDPRAAGSSMDVAQVSLRLGPDAAEGISDGWVGLDWTFTPDLGPAEIASIVFRE